MNKLLIGLIAVVVLGGLVFLLNAPTNDTEIVTDEIQLNLDTPEAVEESAQAEEEGIELIIEEEATIDAELDELENLTF